jgi:hypothetical protein
MVYWQKFNPAEFEFEFDEAELAGHTVSVDEAIEVIWNGFKSVETSVIMVAIRSLDILTVVAH